MYKQIPQITQSAISHIKHTRIDRATKNFPSLWVYSIHSTASALQQNCNSHAKRRYLLHTILSAGQSQSKAPRLSDAPCHEEQAEQRVLKKNSGHILAAFLSPSYPQLEHGGCEQHPRRHKGIRRYGEQQQQSSRCRISLRMSLPAHGPACSRDKPTVPEACLWLWAAPGRQRRSSATGLRALMAVLLQKWPSLETPSGRSRRPQGVRSAAHVHSPRGEAAKPHSRPPCGSPLARFFCHL